MSSLKLAIIKRQPNFKHNSLLTDREFDARIDENGEGKTKRMEKTSKYAFEEMFNDLAHKYHWVYDADYVGERDDILEEWNRLIPIAVKSGMTYAEIASIFKREEAAARAWRIRSEQEEDDLLYA